jgi:hypothetical protein
MSDRNCKQTVFSFFDRSAGCRTAIFISKSPNHCRDGVERQETMADTAEDDTTAAENTGQVQEQAPQEKATPADMPNHPAQEPSDSLEGLKNALNAERKAHKEAARDAAELRTKYQNLQDTSAKQEKELRSQNLTYRVQAAAQSVSSDPLLAAQQAVSNLSLDATDEQIKDALSDVVKAHPALAPRAVYAPVPVVKSPSATQMASNQIGRMLDNLGL